MKRNKPKPNIIHVVVRFMIGVRYDGKEQLLADRRLDLLGACMLNKWTRVDGVRFDMTRFTIYKNPYPIVLPRPSTEPIPVFDEDDDEWLHPESQGV